jgi:hypothetical protein
MNTLVKMHNIAKKLKKQHPNTAYAVLLKKAAKQIKTTNAPKKKTAAKKKAATKKIVSTVRKSIKSIAGVGSIVDAVHSAIMRSRLHKVGVTAVHSQLKTVYRKVCKKKLPLAAKIKALHKKGESTQAIIRSLNT